MVGQEYLEVQDLLSIYILQDILLVLNLPSAISAKFVRHQNDLSTGPRAPIYVSNIA